MTSERLQAVAEKLRDSLWFIPTLMTLGAIGLAVLTGQIDHDATAPDRYWSLLTASGDGAREILSTIAGSIITVTGVVFSITVVAIQLASSQYTPRVLRTFTDDRGTQIVLGIFLATFTYSVLALRAIRADTDAYEGLLPGVSVAISVLFGLASIGALIYYVNHIAHAIRVEMVIERITREVLDRIDVLYPSEIGRPASAVPETPDEPESAEVDDRGGVIPVHADCSGYLQQIDDRTLLRLAETEDLLVRITVPVGSFVIDGDPLAFVEAAHPPSEVETRVRATFHIGAERTLLQDISRGMIELTDIALRALSPSLNDPTTAMVCVDRVTQIGVRLVGRDFPDEDRVGSSGKVRVIAPRPDFDELIHLPLGQLRRAAAEHPVVVHRLIDSLRRIGSAAPPERTAPVIRELTELLEDVRRTLPVSTDRDTIERAGSQAIAEVTENSRAGQPVPADVVGRAVRGPRPGR